MSIQTLRDTTNAYLIPSYFDGAVYSLASEDCVIEGIGDEFTLNYSASSLDVTFASGSQALLCGNFFRVTDIETVSLPSNSTVYLCARIDTSKPNGSTGSFEALTQVQMTEGNINGSDTTRDMLLYVVTTDGSGVTDVADRRHIKGVGTGIASGVLAAGQTTITITDSRITSNSVLSFFTSQYGVSPVSVSVAEGSVTLTFVAQNSNLTVGVKVEGTY